jgi:hypothetical protein
MFNPKELIDSLGLTPIQEIYTGSSMDIESIFNAFFLNLKFILFYRGYSEFPLLQIKRP